MSLFVGLREGMQVPFLNLVEYLGNMLQLCVMCECVLYVGVRVSVVGFGILSFNNVHIISNNNDIKQHFMCIFFFCMLHYDAEYVFNFSR